MTIEQEFFEAFGIDKTVPACDINRKIGDDGLCFFKPCYQPTKTKNIYCEFYRQYAYPPITPEIVLGLEDVLIKEYPSVQYSKDIDEEIGSCIELRACQFIRTPANNKAIGKTRKEALLRLCIQLKDEIQDQVKALFNA